MTERAADSSSPYEVLIAKPAARILRKLSGDICKRIDAAISGLSANPRPPGCRKLQTFQSAATHEALYRIRVGDWRVIYAVEDDNRRVVVVDVTPRDQAYRHTSDY